MDISQVTLTDLAEDEILREELISAKIDYYGFDVEEDERDEILKDIKKELSEGSDYIILRVDGVLKGYTHGYKNGQWYQSVGTYINPTLRGQGIAGILKKKTKWIMLIKF